MYINTITCIYRFSTVCNRRVLVLSGVCARSVLRCVAICCSVLQCVAACCSLLQYVAVYYSVLQLACAVGFTRV